MDLREYLQKHNYKNIAVAFSGGKDSSLLLSMLIEVALVDPNLKIYVLNSDTQIEFPILEDYVNDTLNAIEQYAKDKKLNITVHKAIPELKNSLFVKILGRGYPPPSVFFRWCTPRLKIGPMDNLFGKIGYELDALALGVRQEESSSRKKTMAKNQGKMKKIVKLGIEIPFIHPIKDLTSDDVWHQLFQVKQDWLDTKRLWEIYSLGSDNPNELVDTFSCRTCSATSARFGCFVCTLVTKDKVLENLIKNKFPEYHGYIDLRNKLLEYWKDPKKRRDHRRSKAEGMGPFTIKARQELLLEVYKAEFTIGRKIISDDEKKEILRLWSLDYEKEYKKPINSKVLNNFKKLYFRKL